MTSNGYNIKAISNITASITAAAVIIFIPSGDYQAFLSNTGDYVYLILRNAAYHEIIKVDVAASSEAGGLSVSRGIGGTNRAWSRGTVIFQVLTAEDCDNFIQKGSERQIDYDPNDTLTPLYIGEKVIQTGLSPCQNAAWIARDGINQVWDICAGVECGGIVSDPVCDPSGASYPSEQTVTITSATSGASIYYTTDGSTPDETDTLYSGAIAISQNTVLKCRAFKEDWVTSNTITETYVITAGALLVWTEQTYTGTGASFILKGVAASGTLNVIVGLSDYVLTSADGVTWSQSAHGTGYASWSDVCYGGGQFVAIRGSGTLADRVTTSPDGTTWTLRTAINKNWTAICHGGGLYAAVANDGSIMTSSDGITWDSRTGVGALNWRAITYGNGTFVAVTSGGSGTGRVMTSTDGITWTLRNAAQSVGYYGVCYGNSQFVAVNGVGQAMTSPDGVTWTYRPTGFTSSVTWYGVTQALHDGVELYVAVGNDGGSGDGVSMASTDGISWAEITSFSSFTYKKICYSSSKFITISEEADEYDTIMTGE